MSLTYAVGDIHGSLDKLERLIAACRSHAGAQPMQFVFLGDYIDRGPNAAGVIDFVMGLQSESGVGVNALRGNHEALALAVAAGEAPPSDWLSNGGDATLRSYGVGRADQLPPAHLEWMRSLRLTYDDGRRFFVHAGVDPKKPLAEQDDVDLLWIRQPFLSARRDYGRLVVHGHTPMASGRPELRSNRLNLDTAAVFGGPLTAAAFDETRIEPLTFLQAR